ncbi:MAG: aminotransferase class I/II-fold pyridoxal phosphate-dependent enzyme, partial [Flavobacteriaceae bacterium]|nr:aminotransferase class I/II-fold pyridoxal phosphate-dependent enzyme [Flavobacteriaceae bacterium]
PSIVGASLGVLDVLENDTSHLKKLKENTKYFRQKISKFGFDIKPGNHPIVPVMLYDDHLAQEMSSELLKLNIYVIGFFFPVVPKGQARIRVQISASHSIQDIDKALNAFYEVGKKLKVI